MLVFNTVGLTFGLGQGDGLDEVAGCHVELAFHFHGAEQAKSVLVR